MANSLVTIGIFTSAERLREQLVQHLHENDLRQGLSLALFVERPWSHYLREMSQDRTYGDHLTLQVAADILGISISIWSSLGPEAAVEILSQNIEAPLGHIFPGHFAEN